LRLAVSKTMSRADYSSLSPAVTLNNLDLTGTGGNSDLKPIRSTNYDAALEWYLLQPATAAGVLLERTPVLPWGTTVVVSRRQFSCKAPSAM
jgi:iron complex outermembrane receptor protein